MPVLGDGPVRGKCVLVQGGAGAVGHMAVQIAALSGAEVIATVSGAAKGEAAAGGGARHVVNYRREDVAARVRDLTGRRGGGSRDRGRPRGQYLETDVELLRPHGTIASYSSTSGPELPLAYYPLAFQDLRIHFVQGYLLPAPARQAAIRDLTAWLSAGKLDVRIAKCSGFRMRRPHTSCSSRDERTEGGGGGRLLT